MSGARVGGVGRGACAKAMDWTNRPPTKVASNARVRRMKPPLNCGRS